MATRSPHKGSDPKSGATNPPAPAPALSDRFSLLEKQVTEIRDVLEKLRHLSHEIEEINRRFNSFACIGEILHDSRIYFKYTVTKQKW